MNLFKGGQNIVQAGSGGANPFKGAGNIVGTYFGTKLRRQERDYHRTKDEESRIRVREAGEMSKVKASMLEGLMSPHVVGNYFDVANSVHDENSDEVKSGAKNPDTGVAFKAGDPKRPQFAHFVNNFGIQTSKHGILPGQPAKGELQEIARAKRKAQEDQASKQSSGDEYAGTVARFGKDGSITRQKLTEDDLDYKRGKSEMPPDSMRSFDDSSRPSNQTWTDQQKADLEKERPRTNNLNTGINEGKGGNN